MQEGEVLDSSRLSAKKLEEFIAEQIKDCKEKDILFSVHLKATMMKVSDPIIFGHFVKVFFKDVFSKHAETFKDLKVNANLGWGDVLKKIKTLPEDKQTEINADIEACIAS